MGFFSFVRRWFAPPANPNSSTNVHGHVPVPGEDITPAQVKELEADIDQLPRAVRADLLEAEAWSAALGIGESEAKTPILDELFRSEQKPPILGRPLQPKGKPPALNGPIQSKEELPVLARPNQSKKKGPGATVIRLPANKIVGIQYLDSKGEMSVRVITIKGLRIQNGRASISAYCHERKGPRLFIIDNIQSIYDHKTGEFLDKTAFLESLRSI